jgi:hypothetical protein
MVLTKQTVDGIILQSNIEESILKNCAKNLFDTLSS